MPDAVVDNTEEYAPKIPAQVRRRARQAEELHRQILEQQSGGEGEGGGQVVQTEPPPEPSQQEPLSPVEAAPPPQETQPEWEHRYRTLQGKYDREIAQMRGQVQSLENLIATMRQAPPPQMPPPESVPEHRFIPEEDVNAYGPELIEASRRWARAEVRGEIDRLNSKIASLETGQQRQQAQVQTSSLEAVLERDPEIGNGVWQRMNHDQDFIQWLQEIDPFSGVTRYVMLNHAYAGGDAERTGRFFKAYIREHTDGGRPPPAQPQTRNGNYQPERAGSQPTLEDFAAPGRAPRATPGGGAPERRIWTNRDITAFYEDRMRGKFRGREDEAERLERDIFDAASEGRVRNG